MQEYGFVAYREVNQTRVRAEGHRIPAMSARGIRRDKHRLHVGVGARRLNGPAGPRIDAVGPRRPDERFG